MLDILDMLLIFVVFMVPTVAFYRYRMRVDPTPLDSSQRFMLVISVIFLMIVLLRLVSLMRDAGF